MKISDLAKKGIIKVPIELNDSMQGIQSGWQVDAHNKCKRLYENLPIDEEKLMEAYGYVKKEEIRNVLLKMYSLRDTIERIEKIVYSPEHKEEV